MSKENQELWKAMLKYLEIAQETNERIAQVRRKLSEIGSGENPTLEKFRVKLY